MENSLRVTIQRTPEHEVTLKIEGKVAGPAVPELDRAWRDLAPSLGHGRFVVDLRGVTYLDGLGRNLLAEIHARTGAKFLADTPLTKYFAEEAQRSTGAGCTCSPASLRTKSNGNH